MPVDIMRFLRHVDAYPAPGGSVSRRDSLASLLFAALAMLAALAMFAALAMTSAVHAAPGGPGGPTRPQPPDPPGALRYLVEGTLPNQPDAAVALILRLYAASSAGQIALQPTKLLEETQTVTVVGGHFTATLGGATVGGIPPSLVA